MPRIAPAPGPRGHDTRERILDEALSLMATRGADATGMRAVADACGLNVAALYYHFPSKAALLRAVIAERHYELLLQIAPIDPHAGTTQERMERLLDFCQKHDVEVILGEWDDPASQEDRQDPAADKLKKYGIEEIDSRWSVIICDMLEHFINEKQYTCIKWFNLINEPNGNWSACADFDRWKHGMLNLYAEMAKRMGTTVETVLLSPLQGMAEQHVPRGRRGMLFAQWDTA